MGAVRRKFRNYNKQKKKNRIKVQKVKNMSKHFILFWGLQLIMLLYNEKQMKWLKTYCGKKFELFLFFIQVATGTIRAIHSSIKTKRGLCYSSNLHCRIHFLFLLLLLLFFFFSGEPHWHPYVLLITELPLERRILC